MAGTEGAGQGATEVVIVGAGPAGLWAAFQLSLHGIPFVIYESGEKPGGQCAYLYNDKPIYDMPGFESLTAGELSLRLVQQLTRFEFDIRFNKTVNAIRAEHCGYSLDFMDETSLNVHTVVAAVGRGPLTWMWGPRPIDFPKEACGSDERPEIDLSTFETRCPNLYVIGDAVSYPGKLPLLVSAFHEAALAAFAIKQKRAGGKRLPQEFSSTSSRVRALFSPS